ncbi:MAG: amino acid-binding protein [Actinomycetota bacterium]|nr:amino acid-binding protein [Actinomycetota bacterium]
MPTDLRIVLPNRPGMLLRACEAVAEAGVNVDGICGDLRPGETWGYLHILVENAERTRTALNEAGFEISSEHDVDVLDVEDRPGAMVEAFRKYSDAGENLEVIYFAGRDRLVIGTESMRRHVPGVKVKDAR